MQSILWPGGAYTDNAYANKAKIMIPYYNEIVNHDYIGSFWQCQISHKAGTPERSLYASPQFAEKEDQKIPSHSPIQREHVSPIGGDTIPPSYRVTAPIHTKSNGMGPSLTESMKERKDELQKVHNITNGQKMRSNPAKLETLSKKIIERSDKKALKVLSHTVS